MGMNSTDIVLPETGQVIEMNQEGLYLAEQIPTGAVLVDGLGIGDVGATSFCATCSTSIRTA